MAEDTASSAYELQDLRDAVERLAKRVETLEAQRQQDDATNVSRLRGIDQAITKLRSDVPRIIAQQMASRER